MRVYNPKLIQWAFIEALELTVKPVLSRPKIGFQGQFLLNVHIMEVKSIAEYGLSLMQVKSIAEYRLSLNADQKYCILFNSL